MGIQRSTGSILTAGTLLAVSSALAACGSGGNPNTPSTPEVSASTPYYVMPVQQADGTLAPAVNDYGPVPLTAADCAPPPNVEIALVDDYEGGAASQTYTYNDTTCEVLPVAIKDWQPASTQIPSTWMSATSGDPNAPVQGGNRCGSLRAMHLAGTYTNYGAGLGTLLYNHSALLNSNPAYPPIPSTQIGVYFQGQTTALVKDGDTPFVAGLASTDLSQWDGITFWARRGPYGQDGFRPGLLDRTTADDFNKQSPPGVAACRSIYTVCSCLNGKPCTPWDPAVDPGPDPATIPQTGCYSGFAAEAPDVAGTYCWDPKVDPWPSGDPTIRCGQTACNYRVDTPIPTMIFNPVNKDRAVLWKADIGQGAGVGTMTCSPEPYVFHDSTQPAAQFCYTPGVDADPPEKMDRCQDSWLGTTGGSPSDPAIDTNWHRYMIPFANLRQGTVDQRSPGIDLTFVEALLFAFPGGNLDVWIDDVGFYRATK
ncbi:MAG TPA: hypothetical protein VGM44_25550 [Polyangiaceae bacterium]|jgi:hypothetical protein